MLPGGPAESAATPEPIQTEAPEDERRQETHR
jgi:hypothetical protein